jgi:hypothetical protein
MQIGCRGTMRTAWPLLLVATALLSTSAARGRRTCKFPAVFNFGDSNSDTGGFWAAFPAQQGPFGMTYFGRPAGRASDGRLVIDFIGTYTYLSPRIACFISTASVSNEKPACVVLSERQRKRWGCRC